MKFFLALMITFLTATGIFAQSAPLRLVSTASTNATQVWTGKAVLHALLPINTTSTLYYLKLYNTATIPSCGSGVPVWTIPIPQGAGAGAGVSLPSTDGIMFSLGLGACITGGIADNDNTPAAVGIVVNFGVGGN